MIAPDVVIYEAFSPDDVDKTRTPIGRTRGYSGFVETSTVIRFLPWHAERADVERDARRAVDAIRAEQIAARTA